MEEENIVVPLRMARPSVVDQCWACQNPDRWRASDMQQYVNERITKIPLQIVAADVATLAAEADIVFPAHVVRDHILFHEVGTTEVDLQQQLRDLRELQWVIKESICYRDVDNVVKVNSKNVELLLKVQREIRNVLGLKV